MRISDLPFRTNIKIPERRKDGTYELADYTLGCLNNFGVGTAGLIRKNIYDNSVWFGGSTEYAGSDLDNRMAEIYDSYPDELKKLIIPSTIPLYNGSGAENITRKVFAPTLTMVGCGDNHGVGEGFTWPIFTGWNSRIKTLNGSAAWWWLSSRLSSDSAWIVGPGGSADYSVPSYSFGAVPAFVIPQSVQIDDAPDKDGSYRLTVLNSGKYLYGAELSKAIREELKAQSIKGVSVSCKTFTGGQDVTIKVKATAADFIGRGEYINDYAAGKYGLSAAWFYTEDGESIHRDKLFSLSNEEQRRIIRSHAAREYDSAVSGSHDINHYRIDDNKIYTEAFRAKLSRISAVLDTYHYDDSNSMDDYFDTNFYRYITVVAA